MSASARSLIPNRGFNTGRCLLLVDGHAQAYRSFHAIRELKNRKGNPANAIFGFFKAISSQIERFRPTHCAVVWDGGLDESRVSLHPAYKADRPPMPESLNDQIQVIQAGLRTAGLATWEMSGIEADDWIAKAAKAFSSPCNTVLISSSDKDFMQLLTSSIHMVKPGQEAGTTFGPEKVFAKTGVRPNQIVDWLSMVGDSVDGIPGVPSIGPKTASELLRKHHSMEGILTNLTQIVPERLRGVLASHMDIIRRNQALITLRSEVDAPVTFEQCSLADFQSDPWNELCQEWGFNSLERAFDFLVNEQPELCLT